MFFDGSDDSLEDIYPSLTGVTNQDIYNALTVAERTKQNIKPDNTTGYYSGAIDKVSDCTATSGDGWSGIVPEDNKTAPTFTIYIPNPGFNPGDTEYKSDDTPKVSILDGACAGREFEINGCQRVHKDANGMWEIVGEDEYANPTNGWWYALTCSAVSDDSIGQYFPNVNYQIKGGDQFVLIGIMMPDVYVRSAEERLLSVAKTYLNENDHTQYTYSPSIDNIYMQRNPDKAKTLREGSKIHVYDAGLGIDDEITVSAVKITEGGQLPVYEVTLSDEQEATLAQKVATEVNQKFSQYFITGGGDGSYTTSSVLNKYLKVMTDINGKVYLLCTVDFASQADVLAYLKENRVSDEVTDTTDFWKDITLDADGNPTSSLGTTTTRAFELPVLQEEGTISIVWYPGGANRLLVSYLADGSLSSYFTASTDAEQTSMVGGYTNQTRTIRMTMPTTAIDKCYIKSVVTISTTGETTTSYIWKGKDV